MSETRLPSGPCPECKKLLSAAFTPGRATPAPGDATVCFYCGALCKFDQELRVAPLSELELARMAPATRRELLEIQGTVYQVRRAISCQ